MFEEPSMEKLTINLPPVEVARMDILIEAGYYPSRAEFIRSAVRTALDMHRDYIDKKTETMAPKAGEKLSGAGRDFDIFTVGIETLSKEKLELAIEQGRKVKLNIVGMLRLGKGVTPALIERGIESAKVYGVLRASPEVKKALQMKMERS